MVYNKGITAEMSNRFYFSYSGSAPTGANCTTLAGDIESAWATNLAPLIGNIWTLEEVDVIDIATVTGFSGQWNGSSSGTRSGSNLPAQVATNVEFNIARRYRGGKPRIYLPPGVTGDQANPVTWNSTYYNAVNSGMTAFIAAIQALSIGAMGTLKHVNLSYYSGYTNVEVPGRRAYSIPTYRASAKHDDVTGYSTKPLLSSQRRRRTSTTP